ncbi:MAG: hypothetical protein LUI15_01570 [Firmicutes bacterium]|nr:hypothetical protein [Bacillota bacterium]
MAENNSEEAPKKVRHPLDELEGIYEDDVVDVSEKYSKPSIVFRIIRWIFYALILFVCVAIGFRIWMSGDPSEVKNLRINDALRAAYQADEENFAVYTQTIYDMYSDIYEDTDLYTNQDTGYFYSSGLFYIPSANEIQVSVRYNVRTLGTILSKNGYDENMSQSEIMSGEFFAYRLTNEDDDGVLAEGEYYVVPTSSEKLTRFFYVYYCLTFDGLTVEDGEDYYIEIYMLDEDGEPDYDSCVGRMKIYNTSTRNLLEYDLSSSEKKELSK